MSKLVSTAAEWIVLPFDTPYYTELPPYSPKAEIENWVNKCHRRGCSSTLFSRVDKWSWKFLYDFFSVWQIEKVGISSLFANFCWKKNHFWILNIEIQSFPQMFSYMLWHIDLKFCTTLFYECRIRLDCHSLYEVCFFLKLTILEILHSSAWFTYWAEILKCDLCL